MKNILITGVNGFVGSNCLEYFSKNNNVFGIDIAGLSNDNIFIGKTTVENIKNFKTDFDLIIHLAGSGSVGATQKNPKEEKEKTLGSLNEVLSYIKNHNKNARLILSSSASVYGNNHPKPISEEDSLNPISEYAIHKLKSEKLCKSHADEFDLDVKIIRFFSLYGINCKKQLLFDVLTRIKNSDTNILNCFGTGEEKRDFVNIKDAIDFIEIVSNLEKGFDIFNCAANTSHSVSEIINLLIAEYGKNIEPIYDNIIREGNPDCLIANIKKAKEIGFAPKIELREGIKEYVKWFKNL